MIITFIQSPVGAFGLGYHIGETTELNDTQATELIELGFAIEVEQVEKAIKSEPKEIKKAVKK